MQISEISVKYKRNMAIPASNINEVITELDIIVSKCLTENNKLGLFAALYRKVTIRVKEGIAAGRFDDGVRMEQLDVIFANRYLEAYQSFQKGEKPTTSWLITFDAAKNPHLFLIQHLFAGMNSHISLDLGVATAQTAGSQPLAVIENDFNEINNVLSDLVDEVQKAMEKTSLMMLAIDFLGGNKDEKLARFSLEQFRKRAWDIANRLYGLENEALNEQIQAIDKKTTLENKLFTNVGSSLLPAVVRLAASLQNKKVGAVIRAFNAI